MTLARPLYLLARPDAGPALQGLSPGRGPLRLTEAAALKDRPPGLLLLPIGAIADDELVAALRMAADGPAESGWLPVLVEAARNGQAARLLPVSIGWPA